VVLEGLDLPTHMTPFHARVRAALEAAAADRGRQVASSPGPTWCATPDCFRSVARSAGASEVMTIGGGRNEEDGYRLTIELWRGDSERLKDTGGCDFCMGPDMVDSAGNLARRVLARVPAAMTLALGAASPPAPTSPALGVSDGKVLSPAPGARLPLHIALAVAGALAIASGAVLWSSNGKLEDCESSPAGTTVCRREARTARVGIPLLVAGAAAAGVGTVLTICDVRARRVGVEIGPGTVAVVGNF
jgi:hypothetical protein